MNRKFSAKYSLPIVFVFFMSMFLPFSSSGQDDNRESKIYETGEFTGLFLEGAFGVELIQGTTNSLEVRASDSRAFEYLNVSNDLGLLHLHVDRKPFDFSRVTLYITFKSLDKLHVFGGINLDTRGYLDLERLYMLLEGGTKVNLKLKVRDLGVESRGGVLCELSGVAESLNVRLSGAGHVNAAGLKTRDVDFKIEGVGTGKVHATNTLHAQIKGAGKVKYRGDPKVTQNIEGLGAVDRE